MRRRFFVLILLACCVPAAVFAGKSTYVFTSFANLSNGAYTTIDFPKATDTFLYGLNDLGEIVGRWDDSSGAVHGFYALKK